MDFAKEGDTHMIEEFQTEECEMKRPEIHSADCIPEIIPAVPAIDPDWAVRFDVADMCNCWICWRF